MNELTIKDIRAHVADLSSIRDDIASYLSDELNVVNKDPKLTIAQMDDIIDTLGSVADMLDEAVIALEEVQNTLW